MGNGLAANANGHAPDANGHAPDANGQTPEFGRQRNESNASITSKLQVANRQSDTDSDPDSDSSQGSSGSSGSTQTASHQRKVDVDGKQTCVSKETAKSQASELQELLQEETEAYLDKRHIIDILHDFSGSHPPLTSLLSCLRPLQPRLYSISSSQLEHAQRVQITVAVVKYQALGRERIGVTSTFLKERMQVGIQLVTEG